MSEKHATEPLDLKAPHENGRGKNASWIFVSPRRAAVRTRIAQMLLAVALALYAVLALLAHRYAYFAWDVTLEQEIQSITLPHFYNAMAAISFLGSGWHPFALTLTAAVLLYVSRLRAEALICAVGTGLGSLLDQVLKALSDRPRPPHGLVRVMGDFHYDSFPSGHVMFFVEFFGFLLFAVWATFRPFRGRKAAIGLLAFLIAVIGVSRVYLGAHWPSDVAGAYLVGGIWLTVMIEASRRLATRWQS